MKELKEHNDYVMLTKWYLRRYEQLKYTAESMRRQAEEIREELAMEDAAAPIAKYGGQVEGGSSELNAVESDVERRIRKEKRADNYDIEAVRIENRIYQVNHAYASLSDEAKTLVHGYYFEGKRWQDLADILHISEDWARKSGAKAVRQMAGIIFEQDAVPEQMTFVFARL